MTMKAAFCCAPALLALAALDADAAETIAVATRGADAEYAIALPENPAPSELYAAEELRGHVKALTGVELPIGGALERKIRISISEGFADDEFRAHADGADIVVEGGKRGVLYGVYEMLETYGGIGWFASWHTYVPKADAFALPRDLDVRQKPAILLRMPYWRDVKVDFAARVRANGSFQGVGKKHGGTAFVFGGGLGVCHTFDRLLPAKEHFAAHPEWYCYRAKKGARVGDGRHAQLCLTNPEVLRIVTSNVLDRIRKDPGALCYGVSQNDSREYCECEKCKAVDEEEESHAGTMVRFVNAIAEAVEKEFPGKIIETLAYEYTRKPPKKTKLRHNVMPCLCTSGCDFSVPITESRHESTRRFLDDINGWGAQTKQLYIWDYTVNFHHYLHSFPNILAMQGNLKLFRDNSTVGMLAQGDYTGWHADFGELRAWLMAKWMWNPDLPAEPLLDRFFKGYYGKAAPLARKAFDLVYDECTAAAASTNTPPLVMYADIEREPPSEAVMEEVESLWLEAESVAESDEPVYRYNVRMSAMGAYYTVAMRLAYVGYRKGWPFIYLTRDMAAHARLIRAREAARRTLERIGEAKARGHRVILVEHWPEEWMGVLRGMANAPDPQTDRLVLPASRLRIQMTNACDVVEVADAAGGKAIKFSNAGWHWAATFNMGGVKFDPGEKYRVRIHAKVELTGKQPGVTAFSSGVYDKEAKKSCGERAVAASQAKNGWAWYDVATWEPTASQYLWIASGRFDKNRFKANPAVDALYVDQVELSRVGGDADIDARIQKFRKADGKDATTTVTLRD